MSVRSLHIAIDVRIEGDEISGRAGDGFAPGEPFSGWLGLLRVLDGLLQGHANHDLRVEEIEDAPQPRRSR